MAVARRARGSIRPQGQGTWRIEVRRGRDPETGRLLRTSVTVEGSRRDAERELTRILREIDTASYVEPARETFGEFLERWLRDYAAHNVRPKTLELYSLLVRRHVAPSLGGLPLGKVGAAQIQALYARKLEEGLSAQTVRHMHTVLRESLGHAVKWGLLGRNPAEAATPPRVRRRELTVWTLDEARRFLAAAEGSRYHAAFLLAVFCGLRRGEVLGLKWGDIDWDAGLLVVQRQLALVGGRPTIQELKTAKSRRVLPLDDGLLAALRSHKLRQNEERLRAGARWRGKDWVFCTERGTPVDPHNLVERHFKPLVAKAGVPPIRFHDLRHTHATLALGSGAGIKEVSATLGHATTRMTLDTYAHLLPDAQREALARLREAFMRGQSGAKSGA